MQAHPSCHPLIVDVISAAECLGLDVDVDLPRLRRLGLRNNNGQDTVLEVGLDILLVDSRREAEGAVEFADGAFSDPVPGGIGLPGDVGSLVGLGDGSLVLLALSALILLVLGAFVLNRRLLVLVLALALFALNETPWWLAGLGTVLDAAADCEGVAVGPFDVDILLVDARQLAVELVGFLRLADIELWLECADCSLDLWDYSASNPVIVVEQTEERRELLEAAWEQRHGAS